MAKIQTLLNNKKKNTLSQRIKKVESNIQYLESYKEIYSRNLDKQIDKKVENFEQKELLKLKKAEINVLTNEEYIKYISTPFIEKIENQYYWKIRAEKHLLNKKLRKAEIKKLLNEKKLNRKKNYKSIDIDNLKKLTEQKITNLQKEKESKISKFIEKNKRNLSNQEIQNNKTIFDNLRKDTETRKNDMKDSLINSKNVKVNEFIAKQDALIEKNKTKLNLLNDKYNTSFPIISDNFKLNDNGILKVEELTMQFGGLKAVDNLSFSVKEGEIFGLIGPNGAGKTTVFNCITQFYKPTSGKVYYKNRFEDQITLNEYSVHNVIKEGIVRTFQNVELVWELTVLDNMLVGGHINFQTNLFSHILRTKRLRREEEITRQKAIKILTDLGIENYMYSLPIGLPYGILKKIELARTLMTDPNLIILDEPAAGLNDIETKELAQTIKTIQKTYACTIFLVEHDMGLVMNICDTICAISFGKMLAIGTPSEIQSNKQVQEAYLGGE